MILPVIEIRDIVLLSIIAVILLAVQLNLA
jgi:hypothetical protein